MDDRGRELNDAQHRHPLDRVLVRIGQLMLSGCLGVVTLFAVRLASFATGGHPCCQLVLFPVAAWAIGWFLPRGAPAASVVVTLLVVGRLPWQPAPLGPTAQALWPLHMCIRLAACAGMFVGEVLAAVRRLAHDRRRAAASLPEDLPSGPVNEDASPE